MIISSNSNNKLLVPLPMSLSNSNNTIKNNEIENSLDFILNHFDQNRLFPRTIMTKKLGYQNEVFSKEEALQFFKESDFMDCRINAFPSYTDYKGIQRYPPDLIFIDIDKKDFKTSIGFEVALSTTLKKIIEKLGNNNNDIYPTVLKTGGGYHIILPIECLIVLENLKEFQKYENDKPSQEFLRFAKDFLSNGKADKNNNPSFKSCLLRIPGSINSKYNTQIKIIQKWNNYRPNISIELLLDFRRYLKNKNRQKTLLLLLNSKRSNNNKNNYHDDTYYEWIDQKIVANQFPDYRKIIVNLILAPYLVVIKKLSFEESYQIIYEWLQKCDLLRKLDFNTRSIVNTALATAYKKQIPPMSIITLKKNYKDLYFLLVQKGKIERGG